MKRQSKRRKEMPAPPSVQARQPAFNIPRLTVQEMQKWFVVPEAIPPAIQAGIRALAGRGRLTRPRGRPRVNAARDAQIVYERDVQKHTFGEIAQKMNLPRETVFSAYRRWKDCQGVTKFA